MAGPGSRLEKVGTIFTRVSGLLRSGALHDHNKPIWYDVYAAFPPQCQKYAKKREIKTQRYVPPKELLKQSLPYQPTINNILYLEDLIRAKFYKTYGGLEPIDMFDQKTPSVCQRFVEKYLALESQGVAREQIFGLAAEQLKQEGITLKTFQELEVERAEAAAAAVAEQARLEAEQSETEAKQAYSEQQHRNTMKADVSPEQARADAPDEYEEDVLDDDFFDNDGKK